MAQPTPYDRQFNFQNQQALTPDDPLPAEQVDSEFNALKLTVDEVLSKLELIQRDDGALANASVGRDTLHSSIQLGFGAPEVWNNNTNYMADFDTIFESSKFYKCIETHLSDPSPVGFENDIDKWELIADFSASSVEGLGTMSTQNDDEVVITGGTIDGITPTGLSAPSSGQDAARKIYIDDAIDTLTAYVDTQDGLLGAESGTRMVFQQTAAPTGWTKDATHNDKALRIVSGTASSGGTSPFSTVFGKTATDGRSITQANLPSVTLTTNISAGQGSHSHTLTGANFGTNNGSGAQSGSSFNAANGILGISYAAATLPAMTGTTALGGSGTAHTHPIELRVQYVDCIVCEKT